MTALDLQRALSARGHDPGPLDGVPGRRTRAALLAFQEQAGLAADGVAGARTWAALGLPAEPAPEPPWLAIARSKAGLREREDSAALRRFLRSDGRTLGDPARHPWCGDFVETCLALSLPAEPLPANPYLARSWTRFGRALDQPAPGAILVFWRGARAGRDGHVAFYLREAPDALCVLGGNQSDRVGEAWLARDRLLAIRWPATFPPPAVGPVRVAGRHVLSSNER